MRILGNIMKKLALLLSILTLFFSCQVPERQHTTKHIVQEKESKLVAKEAKIYLGKWNKAEKDTIHFQFYLTNASSSMTIINNIDVSCSCVSIFHKTRAIRPKENVILNGTINLKSQTGHLSKAIFINYGKGNLLTLRVIADIE